MDIMESLEFLGESEDRHKGPLNLWQDSDNIDFDEALVALEDTPNSFESSSNSTSLDTIHFDGGLTAFDTALKAPQTLSDLSDLKDLNDILFGETSTSHEFLIPATKKIVNISGPFPIALKSTYA